MDTGLHHCSSGAATAIGLGAIVLWSSLALLTTATGAVPPLQLTGLTFSLAFLIGAVFRFARRGGAREHPRLAVSSWAIGVGGLFGYHAFYFLALRTAPVVAANLINYLWPLLIVLMSARLPGERLRWFHIAGAFFGFAGAALLITGGRAVSPDPAHLPGYLAALACALIWSGYSVLSKQQPAVPTAAIGRFCGATAALAWIGHFAWETTVWPVGRQWLVVGAMGVGPMGLAFFAWDHGIKHGDIRTLGVLAYLAPLMSTLLLVAAGRAQFTWPFAAAGLMITGGAALASGRLFRR